MKRFVLILLATAAALSAATMSVTPDRTQVAVGDQVMVTVRIVSDKNLGQIAVPSLPASEFYTVARTNQNQSQNSSINIVNGKMTQSVEISYFIYYSLIVKKEGAFAFPGLEVNAGGQVLKSEPLQIGVTATPVQNPDLTVRLLPSRSNPYVGEQIILTMQVAKKQQSPSQLTNEGFGAFVGELQKALSANFSVVGLFKQVGGAQERIGGEFYQVFRARFALAPINAGSITIPSIPFEYVVAQRVQARQLDPFFDNFFGMGGGVQQAPRNVMSSPLTLSVRSLPPAPANFSGSVGSFTLTADADPRSVATGDAVTLKVGLRGNARVGAMSDVTLPPLPDFEAFTPEKATSVDTTDNGLVTRKAYKFLLIPQQEGRAVIPPLQWTYFDPASQAYKTLASDSIFLDVARGKGGKKENTRYLSQAEIREVGHDIRYIKTVTRVRNQPTEAYKNPLFFILYPLPFLSALFAGLYRFQATRQKDVAKQLRSKAATRAQRAIGVLRKSAAQHSTDQLLGKIAGIIEAYISHKFGFAATGKTLDELKDELASRGIGEQTVADLAAFIETMDRYRFGGTAMGDVAKPEMLGKTETFIDQLEKASRKERRV